MKRSETVGNGRKRSETVGNGRKHDQAKTCPTRIFFKISISAQRRFFFEGPKVSKGKRLETVGDRTFARQKRHVFTQFSNIFHEHMLQNNYFFAERRCDLRLFPTVSPWTPLDLQKKKRRCAEMLIFKKMRVEQVLAWSCFRPFPTVSNRFRPFPTVSDRFRPFHFFWTIYWTTSIYGRLIQCKPVQTMTLKFFGATLVRVHCTKYCILTLISNIP